jgi:hypothetical protein
MSAQTPKRPARRGVRARLRGKPRRPGRVSEILERLAKEWKRERVALGDLVETMEQRGHGMLMLVLALPTLLPVNPPGVAAIVGLPAAFVALQLVLRRRHVWLPGFLRRRSVETGQFRTIVEKTAPHIARIERLLKPRLTVLTESAGEWLIGLCVLVIALLLALPIPFTNVPLGLTIVLLSLGLIQRDGVVVLIGAAIALGAAVFIATFGWSALNGLAAFVTGG